MRTESTFRPIADRLWCVDCDAHDKGVHIPLRMSILGLADGLLLYSPVALTDELEARIRQLGDVTHILAPNLHHHLFAAAAVERFPEAKLHGAPGLQDKKPDLPWQPIPQLAEVEFLTMEGVPFTNEIVAYHASSGSLICADVVHNVHDTDRWLTRQLFRMIGSWQRFGPNRVWRFQTKDHPAFARCVDRMLDWQPARVVMCHGDIVEDDVSGRLREAMAWITR